MVVRDLLDILLNISYGDIIDEIISKLKPLFIYLITFTLFLKCYRYIEKYFSYIKLHLKGWNENREIKRKGWNKKLEELPVELAKNAPVTGFYAKVDASHVFIDKKVPQGTVIANTVKNRKVEYIKILRIRELSSEDATKAFKKLIRGFPLRGEIISIFEDNKGLRKSLEVLTLKELMKHLKMETFIKMEYLRFIEEAFADKEVQHYYSRWIQLNYWLRKNKVDLSKLDPSLIQLILLVSIIYYNNVRNV